MVASLSSALFTRFAASSRGPAAFPKGYRRSRLVARARAIALAAPFVAMISSPAASREVVAFNSAVQPGTIVVKTAERRLYLVLQNGSALRYPIAVGRRGKQWFGEVAVENKHVRPAWSPPAEIRRDNPRLPDVIPSGAPNNPMGAAALMLSGGEYAIHGTNRPSSIGSFASYGCIRMHNHDIVDLFDRVSVGTPVMVTR